MAQTLSWQGHRVRRWRRHVVPAAVWLLAAAVAGGLLLHQSTTYALVGIAHVQQRAVAAQTDGRLRFVPVTLFDAVKAGQTLAVLEDDRIQALLATAAAEVARLRSELAAAEDRLAVEAAVQEAKHLTDARGYAVDVESNRLREIELQITLEADRVRLDYLRLQRDLLANLNEQRAVSDLRFRAAEAEYRALETRIGENEKALAEVRLALEQARQRQELFTQHHVEPPSVTKALEPLRAAVTVQERRIAELAVDRSLLVLTSPIDGVVSQLLRGAGESVRNGEPILTIAPTRASAVMAYASAAQLPRLQPGASVRLVVNREGSAGQSVDTRVQALGPTVEQLPPRLWRSPTVPEWGRPVMIAVPPVLGISGGELVGVSLR